MLRVNLTQARDGMMLALPVRHPRRLDTVLLRAGVELAGVHVKRLGELGVRDLWIRVPGLERLAEYVNPGVHEACANMARDLHQGFERVRADTHTSFEFAVFRRAVVGVLERLAASPKAALLIQESGGADPLLRNASTVCFLSVLMGLKLDFHLVRERSRLRSDVAMDVTNLGVGAMLHDIGMLSLPPEVAARWEGTRDESDPGWREHVTLGFEMVRREVDPAAAAVVLHHHQRFDGTGFPKREKYGGRVEAVARSDIHVFARIVAAADLFERLRYEPGCREPAPTVAVLRRLIEPACSSWLDPVVLRALTSVVPPYPPGTQVMLSSGVRGVVTSWTPANPCRPVVEEMRPEGDRSGAWTTGQSFDLRSEPDLEVVEADGTPVGPFNFYPSGACGATRFDVGAYSRSIERPPGTSAA
ncbi:MAG: HD domain-containing protein [Phycisphaerae bacterium]|nr:HD domain-containing protein [Phycisphaerae bacterium]